MSKFRGSARSSGFDAINVPDNAQRVREAGQKRIEELRRTYDQTIRNQKGAADDLQQSYAETRTALDRNISLQRTFEQTYEQALRKKYDQKIAKSKKQAELERNRYDRLSSFSKEAGKLGKQLYEEHKDNRQRDGMALVFNTGLTAEELQILRRGEDELQSEHAATNAVIERLKANGASASEIKQIQELDGWILYGAQKELARRGGDAYRVHLQSPEVRNKKYDLGDGKKMSLQQALDEGKDVEYKTIRGIISGDFLDRYKGYDLAFAEEYLFPGMREANANDDLSFASKAQEQFEKAQTEQFKTGISNVLDDAKAGDLRAFEKFLQVESGGLGGTILGSTRDKFFQIATEMFKEGSLTSNEFHELIMSQQFTIGGKTVTYRDQFYKKDIGHFTAIDRILYDQASFRERQENLEERQFNDKNTEAVIAQINGDGLSDAEVNDVIQLYKSARKPIPPQLADLLVNRSLGIDQKIQYQQALGSINNGKIYTTATLTAAFPDLTPSQVTSLVDLSNSSGPNGGAGPSAYTAEMEQLIKDELKSANQVDPGAQTVGMIREMKAHFAEDVMEKKNHPDYAEYSMAEIMKVVLGEHKRNLAEGKDIYRRIQIRNTDGKMVDATGTKAGFAIVGESPQVDSPGFQKIVDTVQSNPDSLSSTKLLGDINDSNSWASQIPAIAESGQAPRWLLELSRTTNIPWKILFNRQAAQYGNYRIPLSRLEDAAEGISPGFRGSLGVIPTGTAVIMGSIRQTRAQGAQGMEVYRPLLNLIASYESSNDTVHGGYDAMNLGGTHGGSRAIGSNTGTVYFKKPLIKMTLGEVMDKQAAGELHAAGRYQFLGTTLQDVLQNGQPGGISRDSLFDQATQDKLAVTYIRMTMRSFPNDPATGIRGRWIGVKDHVSYDELQQIIDRIQQDTRVQGTAFANHEIDPAIYAHAANR